MKNSSPIILHPVVTSLILAGSMISASFILGEYQLSTAFRLALVSLPFLGFLLFVMSSIDHYRRSDELQQRILLEALGAALVASVLGALGLYYLQKAGFFPPSAYPNLEYFGDVLPYAFVIGYLFGYWNASRRYQ
ncbi:MAG: hypothetical protein ACE5IP_01775 [Terriglobia bacterium]